jgi:hypothetical protein
VSDKEIRLVIAAFLSFCAIAAGVMICVVMQDSKPVAVAALEPQVAQEPPRSPPQPPEPPPVEELPQEPEPEPVVTEPVREKTKAEVQAEKWEAAVRSVFEKHQLKPERLSEVLACGSTSGFAEWKELPPEVKQAFGSSFAEMIFASQADMFKIAAGRVFVVGVDAFYGGNEADHQLTPLAVCDLVVAVADPAALDKEIRDMESSIRQMMADQRKRELQRVVSIELLKSERKESGVILHYRITNESQASLSYLRIQAEMRGLTNDYLDTSDIVLADLPAGDSIVQKVYTDVHPERFHSVKLSLVGDLKETHLLDVK